MGTTARRLPLLALTPLLAATASAATAPIEEVVVRSTRIQQSEIRVPLAVSVVEARDIQLARQQLGIDEALNRVPGVFFQNRYNFNQDLRISIRGFGAQAQFGIAGVHLTVDDIPVTTPDGTAQVDDLDMGSMGRIEVVRGPSGALYGTSAGGAINMYTEEPAGSGQPGDDAYVELRATAGEYGTRKYQVKASGTRGRVGYLASVHHLDAEGFRDFSESEATVFNTKINVDVDDTLRISAVAAGVHSPIARDPGALTPAELASGPRSQARSLNVRCNVREVVDQYRGGVVVSKRFNESHELRVRGYGLTREFDGNLPCPFVGHTAFDRRYLGGGAEYAFTGALAERPLRLVTGVELTDQEDDRRGWAASPDGVRGALNEDQFELVDTLSLYALGEFALSDRLLLTAGGRYEDIEFSLDDRFLSNGDNSDSLSFSEFTPMAGLTYAARDWLNLFASVSTSFETPTFAQFGDPGGGAGINPNLDPQTSTNYEIGAKGIVGSRLRYALSVFSIDLQDQLVPFELADDVFYRNAGESSRDGVELALDYQFTATLAATLAVTVNDFEFDDFTASGAVLDGNDNPGVPENQVFVELAYVRPDGWYAFADVLHVGRFYADDANSAAARVDDYRVANLRAGRRIERDGIGWNLFVGVNNAFDEDYFSNVRINQSFNRFFEPAPGRNVYGGLSIRF
ncbi:MAG: TonB-dependent receptor [Pseudomonadales bacterium]